MNPVIACISVGTGLAIISKGWQFQEYMIMGIGAAWFGLGVAVLVIRKLTKDHD